MKVDYIPSKEFEQFQNKIMNRKPFKFNDECLHKKCSECDGTGRRKDGTTCVHMISCPCECCTPSF